MAHEHHANSLPSELNAPLLLNAWRRRAMVVGGIFAVLSIVLAAWRRSSITTESITCCGPTCSVTSSAGASPWAAWRSPTVQYLSGGKWGLLLRRPLEAMSRCLPLIIVLFLPIGIFMKKLYLWAQYSNPVEAFHQHLITHEQEHAIAYKHPMLNISSVWILSAICFAIWFIFMHLLNKWGLQRDADPHPNVRYWQVKFENLSGFGVLVYSITISVGAIAWVMSLDPTWYSSIMALMFLVGQGYGVLALSHHHRDPAFASRADAHRAP